MPYKKRQMDNMTKPKIIITIDTEVGEKAKFVKEGFEKFVMGKIGDENYGVPKIVDILNEHNIKGEFFVDVYEDTFFGKEKYASLCKYLDESGHGVSSHTHPDYAYDINRINMHEYSFEEQVRIISDGKGRIKKWIGKYPIAHRAGNYGANNNTLMALKGNNILIDSSYYYGHPNSKIRMSTVNDPLPYNQVMEIPVSIELKNWFISIIDSLKHKIPNKFDINSMNSQSMRNSIETYHSSYCIIFLHSSSFISRDQNSIEITGINQTALNAFSDLLDFLLKEKYAVTQFSKIPFTF